MILEKCPICTSTDYQVAPTYDPGHEAYQVVKCQNCQHIYTRITQPINTEQLYEDEVYRVVENRESLFDRLLNYEYAKVLEKVNRYFPEKGKRLDFGCGKGKFAWLAQKDGWEVLGVETSRPRATYAREAYALEVSSDFYEGGAYAMAPFDVITLFHVLEHLPAPKELLGALIQENMSESGLLLLEVPNLASWQAKIAKSSWLHLDLPRHLSHFTLPKLQELAEDLDLKITKVQYFSFHLGVLGMTRSLMARLGYRKNLIYELKNHLNLGLMLRVGLVLPWAFLLEWFAARLGAGGVTRVYLQYKGGKD